jgi:hypothetical protein
LVVFWICSRFIVLGWAQAFGEYWGILIGRAFVDFICTKSPGGDNYLALIRQVDYAMNIEQIGAVCNKNKNTTNTVQCQIDIHTWRFDLRFLETSIHQLHSFVDLHHL